MVINSFDDPLTFHLVLSGDQNFNLSNTLAYDQLPSKLVIFPLGSAVLCV